MSWDPDVRSAGIVEGAWPAVRSSPDHTAWHIEPLARERILGAFHALAAGWFDLDQNLWRSLGNPDASSLWSGKNHASAHVSARCVASARDIEEAMPRRIAETVHEDPEP